MQKYLLHDRKRWDIIKRNEFLCSNSRIHIPILILQGEIIYLLLIK